MSSTRNYNQLSVINNFKPFMKLNVLYIVVPVIVTVFGAFVYLQASITVIINNVFNIVHVIFTFVVGSESKYYYLFSKLSNSQSMTNNRTLDHHIRSRQRMIYFFFFSSERAQQVHSHKVFRQMLITRQSGCYSV